MWYLDYINHCFFIAFVLIIWLKTDAFVEYARLFGLSKILEIDLFDNRTSYELNYPSFLLVHHNNFLTRLIVICSDIIIGLLTNEILFKKFLFSFIPVLYLGRSILQSFISIIIIPCLLLAITMSGV